MIFHITVTSIYIFIYHMSKPFVFSFYFIAKLIAIDITMNRMPCISLNIHHLKVFQMKAICNNVIFNSCHVPTSLNRKPFFRKSIKVSLMKSTDHIGPT